MTNRNGSDFICILGPTAVGKTRVAALTAVELDGEIISADSRQVYRGMDIGTGKDLADYRVGDREAAHHLIDIAAPGSEYNLFAYQQDFLRAYQGIRERGRVPILCGGTGLYLDAVIRAYPLVEAPHNQALRDELAERSHDLLIERLAEFGPLHNKTDIEDRERLIRAIEIAEYSAANPQQATFPRLRSVVFGLSVDRAMLRSRIKRRLEARLGQGMIQEVEGLLARGLRPEQLLYYGLEYKYVTLHITGVLTRAEMCEQLYTAICEFAKRQIKWFRRMERHGVKIEWLDAALPLPVLAGSIRGKLARK